MTKLSREEVEHIAKLARLRLSEEEKELFGNQLSSILDYIAKLQMVDTSAVKPMDHVLDIKNVTRDDVIYAIKDAERKRIINNFPSQTGDLLKVPAVFGQASEDF